MATAVRALGDVWLAWWAGGGRQRGGHGEASSGHDGLAEGISPGEGAKEGEALGRGRRGDRQ